MLTRVNVLATPGSRLALPDMPSLFDFRYGQVCSEDSVQLAVVLSATSAACKPGLHHAALQCCAVSWLPHDSFPLLTRSQWHCCSSLQVSRKSVSISESILYVLFIKRVDSPVRLCVLYAPCPHWAYAAGMYMSVLSLAQLKETSSQLAYFT